jgi:hypothetical protein
LRDARCAKRIRLNDVRARFQKPPMNVANHLRLRQRKKIPIVQEILLGILEPLAADVRFFHPIGADRRAHRPVNDRYAIL